MKPGSHLPRIAEGERRYPPRVLVQDQRARDRRLGALAAVFALTKAAVDADRRALGLLQVHATGIDQPRGVADFAPQADGKAWLGLREWRHRAAQRLRDREIPGAVRQLDHLAEQAVRGVEGRMHIPQ